MARTANVLIALLLILTLTATAVVATQVLHRTPQQLGRESSLVVQGKVAAVRSYWTRSQSKILTETTIQVDATHKGQAVGTVQVLQLGGIVGNVKMTVAGAISWDVGEEVLLFLEPAMDEKFQVAGFSQGKYSIVRDDRGRAFIQRPANEDVELVGGADPSISPRTTTDVTLERFINQALGRR